MRSVPALRRAVQTLVQLLLLVMRSIPALRVAVQLRWTVQMPLQLLLLLLVMPSVPALRGALQLRWTVQTLLQLLLGCTVRKRLQRLLGVGLKAPLRQLRHLTRRMHAAAMHATAAMHAAMHAALTQRTAAAHATQQPARLLQLLRGMLRAIQHMGPVTQRVAGDGLMQQGAGVIPI